MKNTPRSKWFYIGMGFIAIFIIITVFIVKGKISEYNQNKSIVTSYIQTDYELFMDTKEV